MTSRSDHVVLRSRDGVGKKRDPGPVRTMSRRLSIVAIAALVAAVGCGRGGGEATDDRSPAPNEPQRTVRPGQHGPIAKGTFELTGAIELSGDYSVLYSFGDEKTDTCAKIVGEDASGFVIPLPTFKDQWRLVWTAGIRQYEGPGTYNLADLERFKLDVSKTPDAEPVSFRAPKGADAELRVNDDHSGTFAFRGLKNEDGDELAGDASWSCSEGSEGSES